MKLIGKTKNMAEALSIFFAAIMLLTFLFGCDQKTESKPAKIILPAKQESPTQKQCPRIEQTGCCDGEGVVLSYAKAGPYTIIEAENKKKKFWLATLQLEIKTGDNILYRNGQIMHNFYSKSLNKTFDEIIFTNSVLINGQQASSGYKSSRNMSRINVSNMQNPHKRTGSQFAKPIVVKPSLIKKLKDGYTIEELFAKKKELNGKIVKVRGKVVRYLSGIMGRNWIHIQDGTGTDESNDITITTQKTAQNGNIIVATGKLVINKDIGYGCFFPLLIEEADIVLVGSLSNKMDTR